jgi:hypothetical protein
MNESTRGALGVVTLEGGVAEVRTGLVTAASVIFLCAQDGLTTGNLFVSSRTPGVGFTITSSDGADRGLVAWELKEL